MMRRLADCCCFFLPSFYWHFFPPFLLSSWSCSFLATRVPVDRTRCSRQHTSPLSASWNIHGQPGTAAQHRAAQTRDHLFIYFITLLPGCLMHNNSSTCKSIFSPSCSSQSYSPHPFFLYSVAFHWHGSPGYINMPYSISVGILMDHSPPCPSFPPFLLSRSWFFLSLSFTFIRQMGGEWMECWITDVCLWSLMVVLKYNAIIYNPA